ncbi:MAG: hypothetical protein U9R08_02650 [Nanoarchaeota archaeon]|nr:hypothetical protein [Nanoarchaeota archaeon]
MSNEKLDDQHRAPEQFTEDKTEEQIKEDMETGEKNEDVYTEEGRENLVEDGEISAEEEGFMQGAEGKGQLAKCDTCSKILEENIIEKEIDGEMYRFCSDKCAEEFSKK